MKYQLKPLLMTVFFMVLTHAAGAQPPANNGYLSVSVKKTARNAFLLAKRGTLVAAPDGKGL